jgi:hypothetical protein
MGLTIFCLFAAFTAGAQSTTPRIRPRAMHAHPTTPCHLGSRPETQKLATIWQIRAVGKQGQFEILAHCLHTA